MPQLNAQRPHIGVGQVYSEALRRAGVDPRAAWIDQRLTDIILNRGKSTLWPLIHAMEAQDRQHSNGSDA